MGGIEQAVSGEVDDPVLAGVGAGENGAGGVEIERLNPVSLGNQRGDSGSFASRAGQAGELNAFEAQVIH